MRVRTAAHILLVGKDKKESILHFTIVDNLVKLGTSLLQASSVARVHHENQALCTGVVVSPEGSNLVLTTDIPDVEFHILIGDALDVKAHGRNSGDVLVAEFQFVENCCQVLDLSSSVTRACEPRKKLTCLSSSIETQHENPHLLRAEDLPHHLGYLASHFGGGQLRIEG